MKTWLIGDLAQGRTAVRSVVDKMRVEVAKEEWIVIKDAYAPIITREEFEVVQNIINLSKEIEKKENKIGELKKSQSTAFSSAPYKTA